MSRYRGPRLRITRRLGELSGLTRKTSSKQNPPGQHGALPKKPSQYSIRLQEKQKLRFHYGVNEHQLIRLVKKARRSLAATPSFGALIAPGERVLQLLEMRLDTIIFRSGFAPTLRASRQLVSHGHIQVNRGNSASNGLTNQNNPALSGESTSRSLKTINIPSFQMKPGDIFQLSSETLRSKSSQAEYRIPSHIQLTPATPRDPDGAKHSFRGQIKNFVSREDVSCPVNEFLIIEYYSRRI